MSIYDKLGAKTAGVKARTVDKAGERAPRTAPAMFLNAAQRMDAAEARVEELESQLREAESRAVNLEIPLDELYEVEGRRRKLSEEEFSELRENLRNNDLVTPITVRSRNDRGYEIVSGHNRVAAFRELGRQKIPAVVRDSDAVQANINAFYANLLQPSLPDYEKYLGFRMIRKMKPELHQDQLAEMAGVSKAQISKLMSFEELPEEAHQILNSRPDLLGANAALALASHAKKGKDEQVIDALNRIASGELDQGQAIRLLNGEVSLLTPGIFSEQQTQLPSAKPKPPKAEIVQIKVGKATFCNYRKTDTTIRLDFKSAEQAQAVADEIRQVLERHAESLKAQK
ncbi:ParB/RepB/Spo0J family partition protein [Noviherbaspirillum aerium]|uniref:ParB/RepB/Spo0J family partition protein n=1 Tax=Noviherbaspirillum aerium TaxID=2588497 RepID=UPI00178C3124|nr:ParB/RepB/Spo0J family partition protein [Noviherbaspirillum aerium]